MKKIRLLLVFCISFFLSTAILAKAPLPKAPLTKPPAQTWVSFYGSLALGSNQLQASDVNSATWRINLPYTGTNNQAAKLIGNAVLAHIGLGFAIAHRFFYLGIEPYLDISTLRGNHDGGISEPTFNFRVNQQTELKLSTLNSGIDLKPGVDLNPNLTIFAIVGGAVQSVKLVSTSNSGQTTGNFGAGLTSIATSQTLIGTRLGFGVQSWITHHWTMYFNFIHTIYANLSHNLTQRTNRGTDTLSASTSINSFGTNAFLMGVNYYLTSHVIPAWATTPSHVQWNGFFVGVAAGALVNQFIEKETQSTLRTPTENNLHSSELDTGNLSGQGSLFIGVAHVWHRFYLGARGFVTFAKRDATDKSVDNVETGSGTLPLLSHSTSIQLCDVEWGGDLLPGFLITPQTLIHLTIGVADNKATLTSTNASTNPAANIILRLTSKKSFAALRLGVGFQQALTKKIRLTADYIYTNYGHILVSGTTASGTNTLSNSTEFALHNQAVMIGLLIQV